MIDSLTVQYPLFRPDGTPIRADGQALADAGREGRRQAVGRRLEEGPEPDDARRRRPPLAHVVRDGDSLPSIAFASYGDPTRWRAIAEANGIDDPLALRRGRAALRVPQVDA